MLDFSRALAMMERPRLGAGLLRQERAGSGREGWLGVLARATLLLTAGEGSVDLLSEGSGSPTSWPGRSPPTSTTYRMGHPARDHCPPRMNLQKCVAPMAT